MSKSKKSKNTQPPVSPENYIRKRARNLPIVKCIINADWDKSGLASILIVRQHANGNFTFCMYLTDKDCLGVKDTVFQFNASQEELDECIEHMSNSVDVEEISYELAHNIIFTAIEFAEEYGFMPHKDFTSITQYFLEEDTEDIPLIEIHCGNKDGNPMYVNNGYESPAQAKKIISQLEKTAGKGNFTVILNAEMSENSRVDEDSDYEYHEDDDDGDDNDRIYDIYYAKIIAMDEGAIMEESLSIFSEYLKNNVDGFCDDVELSEKTRVLTDFWREKDCMLNLDLSDKYLEMITSDLASIKTVDASNVPNSLFPTFTTGGQELQDDFFYTFMEVYEANTNKGDVEQLKQFAEKYGDCGALSYLKIMQNRKSASGKCDDIEQELSQFPDYFLLQLLQKEEVTEDLSAEEIRKQFMNLVEGKALTYFEMSEFVMLYAIRIFDILNYASDNLLEKTNALIRMFEDDFLNYSDAIINMLWHIAETTQMNVTITVFVKEHAS